MVHSFWRLKIDSSSHRHGGGEFFGIFLKSSSRYKKTKTVFPVDRSGKGKTYIMIVAQHWLHDEGQRRGAAMEWLLGGKGNGFTSTGGKKKKGS